MNKVTVCAHINHIFDLYLVQRKPFMKTYADVVELKQQRQAQTIQNYRGSSYQSYNRLSQNGGSFCRGQSVA